MLTSRYASGFALLALFLVASPAAAQDSSAPPQAAAQSSSPHHFWFNVGAGYGSLGCQDCFGRLSGFSGNLSLGATVTPRFLVGLGTSGFVRSVGGDSVSAGTVDFRVRFYVSEKSGFFLTGGVGFGHVAVDGEGANGAGVLIGVGYDVPMSKKTRLTIFYNGFAMSSTGVDANVGQIGLGITVR